MNRFAAVFTSVVVFAGCSSQPSAVSSEDGSSLAQVAAADKANSVGGDRTTALKPTLDWSQDNETSVAKMQHEATDAKPKLDLSDLNDIPAKPREPKPREPKSRDPSKRSGFAKYPASRSSSLQVASARDTRPSLRPKVSPNLPIEIALREASARDLRNVINAFEGNVVFVDYWATWCGPCVSMFPHTIKMHKLAYQHDLRVITVSLDDQHKKQNVLKFLKHFDATSVNLLAKNEGFQPLSYDFGIPDGAIPHFQVYDRQGKKRYQWTGAGSDVVKDISGRVLELLREK